ncbi:MAG: hypothetical protein NTW19_02225 [Planctomycetota bacterium]|nr:hypothetical protein [Planctomycetota bacterium]
MKHLLSFCVVVALLLGLPLTPARAAEAQTFLIRDWTGRGFAPDVVNYALPAEFAGGRVDVKRLRITTTNDTPVALQISPKGKDGRSTLSFIAEVAPNGLSEYRLTDDGKTPAGASKLSIASEGDAQVLSNGLLAVKLPKPTEKTYSYPIPADQLPAPILAFRSGETGPWLGASRIASKRLVKAWRVVRSSDGPVFAEVRYEIDWATGGYYRGTFRVADRVPLVQVTEEYDLGEILPRAGAGTGSGVDSWELTLTQGWSPDMAEIAQTWGNGGVDPGKVVPLAQAKLGPIQPSGAYGDMISQLGLFIDAQAKADPAGCPLVGVVPLHQGTWRRVQTLGVESPDAGKTIRVSFPMARVWPFWVETSPFCVITHEQELPVTYARRVWGLLLNHSPLKGRTFPPNTPRMDCYEARAIYGSVGLYRYKDFVTEWPDRGVTYPRVYLHAEELEKNRAAVDSQPGGAELKKMYYSLGGGDEAVKYNAITYNWIDSIVRELVSIPTPSHQRLHEGPRWLARAEDALSSPTLDPKLRTHIRAKLATLAYLMTEPDCMGSGNGAHSGNPNMSIARQMWAASLVAMLPDHPMHEPWKAFYAAYAQHKFADNMAPGGGWIEYGGYHMWGYARLIEAMFGLEAMKVPNFDQLVAYHKADLDYFLNLLTPIDPRFGTRMIPGFANSSFMFGEQFKVGASTLAKAAPDFAANLQWAWENNGRQGFALPTAAFPVIEAKEPKLASRLFPGFGVVFRAHQGPDETYMIMRSGFLWSHWYVDQNQLILNSKRAVLLPSQPYAYYTSPNAGFSQYNDIRFGHPTNEFPYSWPDSNVLDAALASERVQYAWSSTGYPAWFINPGRIDVSGRMPPVGPLPRMIEGVEQKEGDFAWDRQIAFLIGKTPTSPNYFVIRDSLSGAGKLAHWFNLNLLGRKANVGVEGERIAVDTEFPTKLDLLFPGQALANVEMAEDDEIFGLLGHRDGDALRTSLKDGPISPNWARKDGTPIDLQKRVLPDIERHVLVRVPGGVGQDRFWVASPRGAGEAQAQATRLSPQVVKVKQAEGTDYVLLAPHGGKFVGEEVTLEGSAAAVRIGADEVTLALLGGAGRVGYKGRTIEGVAPLERTFKLAELDGGSVVEKGSVVSAAGEGAASIFAPQLKGHVETSTPGVRKAADGERTEYLVAADRPTVFAEGDVQIEARRASVLVSKGSVRFVAPEATYVKLVVGTRAVRGVGPFDLTFTDETVTGTIAGKTRSLAFTRPAKIVRPMFHLDGVRWFAGYSDETAPFRGREDAQFSMALGTTEGKHKIEVREWTSPILPPTPPRREAK